MQYEHLSGIMGREFDAQEAVGASLWSLANLQDEMRLPLTSVPAEDRRPWDELDATNQAYYANEIQMLVQFGSPTMTADFIRRHHSPEAAQAVADTVRDFYDTLPLADAERRWLAGAFNQAGGQRFTGADIINRVRSMRGVVVTLGRYQPVSGQELVDRMWDWRRLGGDYNQGTEVLEAANTALDGLRRLFRGNTSD